jgi:hypothetical protein
MGIRAPATRRLLIQVGVSRCLWESPGASHPARKERFLRQEVAWREVGFGALADDCLWRVSRGKGVALEGDVRAVQGQVIYRLDPVECYAGRGLAKVRARPRGVPGPALRSGAALL